LPLTNALFESTIPELPLIGRGKVRDIYGVDDEHLLIVTTDRLSAFDVVLPDPVPGKGEILTKISRFWFGMMADLVPNQLTALSVADIVHDEALAQQLEARSLVVKRLKPLPIEAVVRGYLIGSGWRDYLDTGTVCGIPLPNGIEQAGKLPETLFTPSSKADAGSHDENIDFDTVRELLGQAMADAVRDVSIAIYERAARYALGRGIIIAGDEQRSCRGFGKTNSPLAFGHNGAGGQLAWADPATGLSLAYCTNGHDRNGVRQGRRGVAIGSLAAQCVRS